MRRRIAYEEKIPEYIRSSESLVAELTPEQRAEVTFEEVSPEFHFDSDHLYPPLRLIVERLLERYAAHVDLRRSTIAGSPWLGPLPNLNVGSFLAAYDCEIEVRPAGGSADVVFAARGAHTARIAYPVKPGQRSPSTWNRRTRPSRVTRSVLAALGWVTCPDRRGGRVVPNAEAGREHWAKKTV